MKTEVASGPERRFAPKDVLPFLITAIAGIVCYGLFIRRGMGLSVMGYNISPAERVMQGEVPYRDFLYNYTPGVLWLNALLMKLFGANLITINAGLFAFKLATLICLFYVARRLTSASAALVVVALTLGWVGYRHIFRVYPTQYSMLFVLVGLIFMLHFDKTKKLYWLFFCGMAVGAVFIFKHNVGILLLASTAAAIVIREVFASANSHPLPGLVLSAAKKAALCWAGFAAVAATILIYLAHNQALRPMLDHFFSLAAEYGERRSIALPPARLLAPAAVALLAICAGGLIALRKAPRLFEPFVIFALALGQVALLIPGRAYIVKDSATAAISYLPLALLILAFATLAWQFKSCRRSVEQREQWWRSSGPILIVALFALGAYLEMYPRADYSHLVRVLPPIFLLLLLLVARNTAALATYFQNYLPSPRRAALLCAAAPFWLLLAVGIKDTWQPRFDSSFRFIEQTPLTIERARGILTNRKQAEFIEDLASAIEANSSPDDYIFSFAPRGTAFYFLTGRRNPTRLVWWRSVGVKGEDKEALLDKIASLVPKLILVPDGLHDEQVRDRIRANYHQIAAVADIAIYDRNQ